MLNTSTPQLIVYNSCSSNSAMHSLLHPTRTPSPVWVPSDCAIPSSMSSISEETGWHLSVPKRSTSHRSQGTPPRGQGEKDLKCVMKTIFTTDIRHAHASLVPRPSTLISARDAPVLINSDGLGTRLSIRMHEWRTRMWLIEFHRSISLKSRANYKSRWCRCDLQLQQKASPGRSNGHCSLLCALRSSHHWTNKRSAQVVHLFVVGRT